MSSQELLARLTDLADDFRWAEHQKAADTIEEAIARLKEQHTQ